MVIRIKTFALFLILAVFSASAAVVKGNVTDATGEAVIGATVKLDNTENVVVTDVDGNFSLLGVSNGKHSIEISYTFYKTQVMAVDVNDVSQIKVTLQPESRELKEVVVTAQVKRNTETSMIAAQRQSLVIQTGVSSQQIKRTQDRDASEVIRRVPGISIIDDKFVMVRGLSQRYNNVWINNSAVPSSEPDSRSFSFDLIPSSQIDNMVIVKSPAPEYPADFSGGFILINTKDIPATNSFNLTLGGNINDKTHFKDFSYSKGSSTDWLGFDGGLRSLQGGINATLNSIAGDGIDLQNNGFNNDWTVRNRKPLADFSLNSDMSHRWSDDAGRSFAVLAALNYSNAYTTLLNMENSLFGAYNTTKNCPTYLRHSTDDQFNHNVRLGAMLNFTYVTASGNSRYEFKNIFNQLGRDRYTYRHGISAQSDNEESAEYYYTSRTTYSGQLTGYHNIGSGKFDWSAGYSYANNCMPDRRRYLINDALEIGKMGLSNANDINREFTRLDEHIMSINANYKNQFSFAGLNPTLKAGVYSEFRTRTYTTRLFIYNWNSYSNTLPANFRYLDIPTQLLVDANYGADKLYMLEKVKWSNNYSGNNFLAAGYLGFDIPLDRFNIYAGVRYEHNKMKLTSNTRDYEKSPRNLYYPSDDLFPSINASYKIDSKNTLRLAYGKSINRPEFREVSPSVYYDFDLASDIQGNYDLKPARIQNVDFRYEYYPSAEELISASLFYKNFKDPIEWTYTVNGGTDLTYSYINAKAANSYGVEIDLKKNLDFIGLRGLSLNFNGALIHSRVDFESGAKEKNRAMQGQSPYLVNLGLFYEVDHINLALLFNRIGRRIIGVGRSLGTGDNAVNIPDSYEMPRNSLDFSASKRFNRWEVRLAARNILNYRVSFRQFETISGNPAEIEEISRQYRPGRNYNFAVSYQF